MSRGLSAAAPGPAALLDASEVAGLLRQGASAQLRWTSSATPLHGRVGEQIAQRTGSGLDYAETRLYQSGDDPRHVHWRATARTGNLQVRQFHQDVNPSVFLAVDRGASMRFGTRRRLKITQAARLGLYIAAHEVHKGHELAALMMEPEPRWLPPTPGTPALRRLSGHLLTAAPPLRASGGVDRLRLLSELARRLAPGSRLYLISDFLDLGEPERHLLTDLGHRFDTRALVVFDAAERELPPVGPLLLSWAGLLRAADGRRLDQRQAQARAWQAYRADLQALFARARIGWRLVPAAQEDLAESLAEVANEL